MINPVDFYLGFDKRYFLSHKLGELEFDEKRMNELASDYLQLLQFNKELLNSVLLNEKKPEEIPENFLDQLCTLGIEELHFMPLLIHPYELRKWLDEDPVDLLCEATGVYELTPLQEWFFKDHVESHLFRLMFPVDYGSFYFNEHYPKGFFDDLAAPACESFVEEYFKFISSTDEQELKSYIKVNTAIAHEGSGVKMFWTIAPFIHFDLKQRGMDPHKSFKLIFNWVSEASEKAGSPHFIKTNNFSHVNDMLLYDIDVLGLDERMPRSLNARLLAKYVSRGLFNKS